MASNVAVSGKKSKSSTIVRVNGIPKGANNKIRGSSQTQKSPSKAKPFTPGRPVQFCTAVSKKPATTAHVKPKIISWPCHHNGLSVLGNTFIPERKPPQTINANTLNTLAKRKKGLKPNRKSAILGWRCAGSSMFNIKYDLSWEKTCHILSCKLNGCIYPIVST